ncbi:MAG: PilN domain-containing protein [Fluviicola sp.]
MNWLKKIWSPKTVVVIFVKLKDGEMEFIAELAGKKSKEFGLYDDLESLVKSVGKSRGYHLHVQGQGVLTRVVESLPNFREQLVIGGNSNDFYFTSYNDDIQVAASFVRKAVLEESLTLFEENKWHLLGISCGEIPLCATDENGSFHGEQRILLKDGKIETVERNPNETRSRYRNEIAQAIVESYSLDEEAKLELEWKSEALDNYKEFTQFKVLGLSLLTGLLLSLLGNYFYQNHLNQTIAELEMNLTLSNENLSLLDRLYQEKTRKEQLVANAGVTSPKFLSYYLDEIGQTVPETVDLQEMYLFPLDGKLKNKQKVSIQSDRIIIQGTSPDNVTLDDWMELMDRFEWVKAIELLHYGKVSDKQAEFKLEITLIA